MTSRLADKSIRSTVGRLPVHGAVINVSVTAAAAVSSVLTAGQVYDIVCDQHVYICEAPTAVATATSDDYLLPAYTILTITPQINLYVSAIRVAADSTLKIQPRFPSGV